MKTLGIDLASQPENTAACLLSWQDKLVTVETLAMGCTDARLDELMQSADAIGVDAPFGWPVDFSRAVADWTHTEWNEELRDNLTLRETDKWVARRFGKTPLRVAADRIAMPAMRTMALLRRHGVTDRSGPCEGRFFEVYPAASLAAWGITDIGSYKSTSAAKREAAKVVRRKFLGCMRERFSLIAGDELAATDHALDALVAALTAHAAKIGGTFQPDAHLSEIAHCEGWIHVPQN